MRTMKGPNHVRYSMDVCLQIEQTKKTLKIVKSEVDALELRNLGLMETVTSSQLQEAEFTRELMQSSARKKAVRPGAGSTSELPSLIDVAKCTNSDEVGEL